MRRKCPLDDRRHKRTPPSGSPPSGVAAAVCSHGDHHPLRHGRNRKAVIFQRHLDANSHRVESPRGRAAEMQAGGLFRKRNGAARKPVAMQHNMVPTPDHPWTPRAPRRFPLCVVRTSWDVHRISDSVVNEVPVHLPDMLAPQRVRILVCRRSCHNWCKLGPASPRACPCGHARRPVERKVAARRPSPRACPCEHPVRGTG